MFRCKSKDSDGKCADLFVDKSPEMKCWKLQLQLLFFCSFFFLLRGRKKKNNPVKSGSHRSWCLDLFSSSREENITAAFPSDVEGSGAAARRRFKILEGFQDTDRTTLSSFPPFLLPSKSGVLRAIAVNLIYLCQRVDRKHVGKYLCNMARFTKDTPAARCLY